MNVNQCVVAPMFMRFVKSDVKAFLAGIRSIGFSGVEVWSRDQIVPFEATVEAAGSLGMRVVSMVGHEHATEKDGSHAEGFSRARNHDRLEAELRESIDIAARCRMPGIIVLSGHRNPDESDYASMRVSARGLKRIAPYAEEKGVNLNMEILNTTVDHPRYLCDNVDWVDSRTLNPEPRTLSSYDRPMKGGINKRTVAYRAGMDRRKGSVQLQHTAVHCASPGLPVGECVIKGCRRPRWEAAAGGVVLTLALACAAVTAEARVWKVKQGGAAGADCDAVSLEQAKNWQGVRAGDEVWVFPGVYTSFSIGGDWAGTRWLAKTADGQPVVPEMGKKNPVIIDAAGAPQGICLQGAAMVRGFEIKGARGNSWAQGTGIWIMAQKATVQDCLLYDNGTYGIFLSNGSQDNLVKGCTVIGQNIEESGMQGVKNNAYEANRVYDGVIRITDWEGSKLDNGFKGKDNVYYGVYPRPQGEKAPDKGLYGVEQRGWAGYMEIVERAKTGLNPNYLPKIQADFFPTYGGKLLVTLYARKLPVRVQVEGAEIVVTDPRKRVVARGVIDRLTEPLNDLAPVDMQDLLYSRGSKRPQDMTTYSGVGRLSLVVEHPVEGEYTVTAHLHGEGLPIQVATQTFTHQRLPWDGNKIGISDEVLPPWTPLVADAKAGTIACTGRVYTLGPDGLFAQIRTADDDMLAGPMRLTGKAGGKALAFAPARKVPRFRKTTPALVETEARQSAKWDKSALDVRTAMEIEYDGCAKIRMELVPSGKVELDELKLIIPLKNAWARHLHKAGPDMRASVWTGVLPDKPGRAWDSTMMIGKPNISSRLTVGSFVPSIWIGRAGRGGLAYMADNDKGWFPTDDAPAFEVIRREDGVTEFVLNLAARPAAFDKPRQIVFALQATPVKPLADDFRVLTSSVDNLCSFPGGQSKETPTGWDGTFYPLGADGKPVQCGWWGGWANSPFAVDWEQNKKYREKLEQEHRIYIPYQTYNFTNLGTPLDPRTEGPEGPDFWKLRGSEIQCDGHGGWCMVPANMEYRLYRYRQWVRNTRNRGFYFDNSYPIVCRKIETGCGYVKDDGRIQPGFTMFGMREFFKRLNTMIRQEGLDPVIFTHSTDTVMAPAYAFVSVIMNGENAPVTPETGKYYAEIWDPVTIQIQSCPEQWGIPTIMMSVITGNWKPDGQGTARLFNQERSFAANLPLHDTESHFTHHRYGAAWPIGADAEACKLASFDITRKATFLPYWEESTAKLVRSARPSLMISGYKQDDVYVFFVFNQSRDVLTAEPLHVDLQQLFGKADAQPKVWVNGKPVETKIAAGVLEVPISLEPQVYELVKIAP